MTGDIEDMYFKANNNKNISITDETKLKSMVKELINLTGKYNMSPVPTTQNINESLIRLRRKYKIVASKYQLRYIYQKYYYDIPLNKTFSRYLIKNACRSRSGVLVCTVVLRPDVFSCPKKCSYCPTETDKNGNPTQPKSYLSSEPAMLRAIQYNFDVKGQIWDRIQAYQATGNIPSQLSPQRGLTEGSAREILNGKRNNSKDSYKLEIIVSGGTWESYPYKYRNKVMNEIYYAANTFNREGDDREMYDISEEIRINETSRFRVIGLTIETRPDFITKTSIKDYRRWGITRVQIGVQHYDDLILQKINRDCNTADTIKAIRLLKQTGFKVVCHLMPDLPGSSPEKDRWMFYQAIHNSLLQFDDVKIYPTAICKSNNPNLIVKSDIYDWYQAGEYVPYAEKNLRDLMDVLKEYKRNIQPWVRIQRLVRDIPQQSIEAGYERKSHLRQVLHDEMKAEGRECLCIRCKEIGYNDELMDKAILTVRNYSASEGEEYFISYESNDWSIYSFGYWRYLFYLFIAFIYSFFGISIYFSGDLDSYNGLIGFCRLRLDPNPGAGFISELEGCALIREVHVYGHSLGVGSVERDGDGNSQHKGFGKGLIRVAEQISRENGYKKIAVIAGIGTREYYSKKCGYHLEGTYMIKNI